ncbi:hypothetical protein Scep_001343 [Stephania cephalantha]|uniref:Uncharacterized protein n=1 Tax=Stephania cephalantha TaxID=152367 RepID=A0AAP0L7Q4_9MAGN
MSLTCSFSSLCPLSQGFVVAGPLSIADYQPTPSPFLVIPSSIALTGVFAHNDVSLFSLCLSHEFLFSPIFFLRL